MKAHKPVILDFSDVSFSYGSTPVLERVSFHLHEGEFTALVGPNGAGKTTVLKLVLGLERPIGGTIRLFGEEPRQSRSRIGYVPQHASFDAIFPISVREVVRMGRLAPASRRFGAEDNKATTRAMEQSGIADLATRPYSALSGGQRRRVLVARALAAEPDLLILDEPTANMDAESETRLFATLGSLKERTSIMIVTHDTGFVSSLTDVVLCVGGRDAGEKVRSIVRHAAIPAPNAPPDLYGGSAAQVLHDSRLADSCCEGEACQ